MQIRYIIIEDEQPTMDELKFLLDPYEMLTAVGMASDGDSGLQMIKDVRPDVVFLDINMPTKNGVEVVKAFKFLEKRPLVVFTTAFREYAVDAFELGAVDYLLKPYDTKRLEQVVERLRSQVRPCEIVESLDRIPAVCGEKTRLIPVESIYYVMSDKENICIHCEGGVFHCPYSLNEIAERTALFRIHRSYLVNLKRVVEFFPWFNGTYQVVLDDRGETNLTVSRSFVRHFKDAIL